MVGSSKEVNSIAKISIISIGLKNSGNLGAIARLCDNFKLEDLVLINPECSIDKIAYERATRGKDYLDNVQVFTSLEEAKFKYDMIIAFSARTGGITNFARPALAIQELAVEIRQLRGSVALLFGREDHGLSNEEVAQCDMLVHIPIATENPVLNISHAAAIALYEIHRDETYSSEENSHRVMSRPEKDVFIEYLRNILKHSWLHTEKYDSTIRVFETILSRSMVTNREAPALIGTMRAISRIFTEGHPPWDECGL
ncbi:MAG: RNA methyltransferase [Candidatus Heimdallarchaeota archaeon]|nr:RNA methyltransferase [Candidatus Heimdallarchaeota archaeon]